VAGGGHAAHSDEHDHIIEMHRQHSERHMSLQSEIAVTYTAVKEVVNEVHDKLHRVQRQLFDQLMKASSKIKILIGTYQILVLLPLNFRLSEPYIGRTFRYFCNAFMFMHFDIMRGLPLTCYREWNYLDSMRAITSIPLVLTAVLIATYLLYVRYYAFVYRPSALFPTTGLEAYFRRHDHRLHTLAEAEEAFSREVLVMRQNMMSRFLFVCVVCSYMSVPHVLLSAIRVWDCVDIDPLREVPSYSGSSSLYDSTYFLRADLSINCDSDEYASGKAYVVFMCILYPVIFTTMYVSLYLNAQQIARMAIITASPQQQTATSQKESNILSVSHTCIFGSWQTSSNDCSCVARCTACSPVQACKR
jgi:virulence-associated protein VapD